MVTAEISGTVESIVSNPFCLCSALETVSIGEGLLQIHTLAFHSCSSLRNITIPKSVTYIASDAFQTCTSLQFIEVSDGNQAYSNYGNDGILYNISITEIICYPAGVEEKAFEFPSSVTSIGENAFHSCSNLASILFLLQSHQLGVLHFGFVLYWQASQFRLQSLQSKVIRFLHALD